MNIPSTLRAGDTIEWDETVSDYPATDDWTLAFVLTKYGASLITITASSSGADYAISVLPAVSRLWAAGTYSWQAYVYKDDGATPTPAITEKYTLESGQVEILPDITQATSTSDLRSHAKKTLEAIEALLEGKATADVLSYSIGGRSLSKMSPEELIKWRSFYKTEYERELEAEGIARGLDSPRRVGVRFRRV
jgi:hypothetical protein